MTTIEAFFTTADPTLGDIPLLALIFAAVAIGFLILVLIDRRRPKPVTSSVLPPAIVHKRPSTDIPRTEDEVRQSQKMEAIGRLAGGVAHDFNNILTAILGYSDMLLQNLPKESPLRRDVEEIKKAGQRGATLTRQLLALSRRQTMEPKFLSLNQIVSNLLPMLHRVIGENVRLVTTLHHGLGTVKADPGQMEQVILNLVVNARDAMPSGGIITIQSSERELDRELASKAALKPGRYVILSVKDSGVGMDTEVLSHIFEPFFTTKTQGKGTGLGLSTVHGIVHQTGGGLTVQSKPGEGSEFRIYLPLVEGPKPTTGTTSIKDLPGKGSETILLVEDEESLRLLARQVLEGQGYRVFPAAGSDEAIAILEQNKEPIHMLLSDIVMPKMDGHELSRLIRKVRPDIRVLLMSGYTDDAIIRNGDLESGTGFLQKPFTPPVLLRKVREVLDQVGSAG